MDSNSSKHKVRTAYLEMKVQTYTLAELTTLTGMKRRTVQLWAEAGALQADPSTERAGTGTHRRFSKREAVIALMLTPFARMQISIGELIGIADNVRKLLISDDGGVGWDDIQSCIEGELIIYLVVNRYSDHRRITLRAFEPQEDTEGRFAAIGADFTNHEDDEGTISILLPLRTHLKVLR